FCFFFYFSLHLYFLFLYSPSYILYLLSFPTRRSSDLIVNEQFKAGDLLIMMSDGIFDGPKHVANTDMWFKRKLRHIQTDNPQDIADLLLEEVIRTRSGEIEDDMTILVGKIIKNTPKWSSIPMYQNDVK